MTHQIAPSPGVICSLALLPDDPSGPTGESIVKRARHSRSKRERGRRLRQYLNDPNLRVRRGKLKMEPGIELPEGGDWSELIAQAKEELREAAALITYAGE